MNALGPCKILIVLNTQGLLFEGAGLLDIFHQANYYSGKELYELTLAGTRDECQVKGRAGYSIVTDTTISRLETQDWDFDTLIITGSGQKEIFREELIRWVQENSHRFKRIVSICSGALLLAEAGLLRGKRATTHWQLLDQLSQYPGIVVEDDPIYVRDGSIWTSAGASSGFDLALALIEEDFGFELAKEVAQYLVLYLRRPGGQSQFSSLISYQTSSLSPVNKAQDFARSNLSKTLKVEDLAEVAHLSLRHFSREFKKELGIPPGEFLEKVRLDQAKLRLEQSNDTLETIAGDCGFETALSLRRLFAKYVKISPSEYRKRFGRI